MQTKRVLVVDDSVFMRRIVSDLVSEHSSFQVVGTAKNGKEAIEQAKELKPDVITMDVEMPEMNGLDALRIIMKEIPTPVIMLSSLTTEGAVETLRALELGAIDFVCKPSGSISLDLFKVKTILHEKLEAAAKAKLSRSIPAPPLEQTRPPAARPSASTIPPSSSESREQSSAAKPISGVKTSAAPVFSPKANREKTSSTSFSQIVAIGTSTGGPRALQQVLTRLPGDMQAPVVIVQHMPPNFTNSLAQRLDSASEIRVVEGQDGMLLETATAYIAPGGYHMRVARDANKQFRLKITQEEPRGGHRPAVDYLFESLLPFEDIKRHIVLMTGMGSDGAKSMLALKAAGANTTIAESDETCVVYGMPRAAVELGCVDHILPVHDIAAKISQVLSKS